MSRVVASIARVLSIGLAGLLALMVALTVWQVFARYVLGTPDPYSEEILRIALIWLGLLAGAYCVHRRAHVGFSTLFDKLGDQQQVALDRAGRIAIAVFALVVLVYGGLRLLTLTVILEQTTPALGVPVAITYAAIPLSGLLIIVFSIWPAEITLDQGEALE